MSAEEIIEYGKAVFNFHPAEKFNTISEMLEVARKSTRHWQIYDSGCAILARKMARELDCISFERMKNDLPQ
jgi:uncharacterized protein YaiE (UPF0345 family)